jgi:pyridoxal phosphate enzyme (YggS family)
MIDSKNNDENLTPLQTVLNKIALHCQKSNRDPSSVQLVAVSKTQSLEKIALLANQGQTHFGENYVQEALQKILHFKELQRPLQWHMIGHLQSNKVKDIAGKFELIHSVDSLELAQKIDQQTASRCRDSAYIQKILLQVHLGDEETKSGIAPDELFNVYERLLEFKHILVSGLMTMPPLQNEAGQNRGHFRTLKKLLAQLHGTPHPKSKNMIELSMGTSHDFHIAVEEGASIVRVGTSLFGQRI